MERQEEICKQGKEEEACVIQRIIEYNIEEKNFKKRENWQGKERGNTTDYEK